MDMPLEVTVGISVIVSLGIFCLGVVVGLTLRAASAPKKEALHKPLPRPLGL